MNAGIGICCCGTNCGLSVRVQKPITGWLPFNHPIDTTFNGPVYGFQDGSTLPNGLAAVTQPRKVYLTLTEDYKYSRGQFNDAGGCPSSDYTTLVTLTYQRVTKISARTGQPIYQKMTVGCPDHGGDGTVYHFEWDDNTGALTVNYTPACSQFSCSQLGGGTAHYYICDGCWYSFLDSAVSDGHGGYVCGTCLTCAPGPERQAVKFGSPPVDISPFGGFGCNSTSAQTTVYGETTTGWSNVKTDTVLCNSGPASGNVMYEYTATLSNPYTIDQWIADAVALINNFPIPNLAAQGLPAGYSQSINYAAVCNGTGGPSGNFGCGACDAGDLILVPIQGGASLLGGGACNVTAGLFGELNNVQAAAYVEMVPGNPIATNVFFPCSTGVAPAFGGIEVQQSQQPISTANSCFIYGLYEWHWNGVGSTICTGNYYWPMPYQQDSSAGSGYFSTCGSNPRGNPASCLLSKTDFQPGTYAFTVTGMSGPVLRSYDLTTSVGGTVGGIVLIPSPGNTTVPGTPPAGCCL